jgi:glutamine amidotransferase
MPREVVIVDYGSGNLRSMSNALGHVVPDEHVVRVSGDPTAVRNADRLVLPGVGAFGACRAKLDELGLTGAVTDVVRSGRPFLGVCVGMQILADQGEEFGEHAGLGWIPGRTRRIPVPERGYKLPHIGWAALDGASHPLFHGLGAAPFFYFVHSFFLDASEPADIAARVTYGVPITAAVARRNVFGCQFHPEKSDRSGLGLLANFCRWTP